MSFIDDLVEIGVYLDWISPLVAMAMDLANDGGYTFLIDQACGWTGGEIVGLLAMLAYIF